MTDDLTYEAAVGRIEQIIKRLDSGEAGLRETLDLVKEGRDLVEYCAGELEAVLFVARHEVGDARLGVVRARAAELLHRDVLAGDGLDDVRPGDEHV